ncbi:hypothetical protein TNCV_3639041 [Trichonephila clavipes]|nr:hypothetical protein TNCV_3639041 [Trichonephila clavipes]
MTICQLEQKHIDFTDCALLKHMRTSSLAEIVEVEIEVVSPSIVPSGSFTELKSHCHLYGAQGRRTYCPCHDEFRGPRSDYVRQVALATTTTYIDPCSLKFHKN